MIESRVQKVDPSIVVSIFRRYKVESEIVKPFTEFDEHLRIVALQSVKLDSSEEPTLLSFTNPDSWLLLTTDRLIWRQDQETQWMPYSKIDTVDIDRSALTSGLQYKTESEDIEVQTLSGQKITLHTGESGAVRLALLNALQWTLQKIKSS